MSTDRLIAGLGSLILFFAVLRNPDTASSAPEYPEGSTCVIAEQSPFCYESDDLGKVFDHGEAGNMRAYAAFFPGKCELSIPGDKLTILRSSASYDGQLKVKLGLKKVWIYAYTVDCKARP